MAKIGKRMRAIREKIIPGQVYTLDTGFQMLRDFSTVKFRESVEVAVNLGVDPRKSDQVVRGSTVLPHGLGKLVRVAVFAQGAKADEARAAGADIVGLEDLAASIKAGNIDFHVCIASPDTMRVVGPLGQILGPRGLMPNPKVGTVTTDVVGAVRNAKAGQVRYRTDKAGIIHCPIGKIDFKIDALRENLQALMIDLKKLKPATSKGIYIQRVNIATTMGPGIRVDHSAL
ncbi:50S ribosomal subunit protein L1 [Gammaproteobacteria bacterium]